MTNDERDNTAATEEAANNAVTEETTSSTSPDPAGDDAAQKKRTILPSAEVLNTGSSDDAPAADGEGAAASAEAGDAASDSDNAAGDAEQSAPKRERGSNQPRGATKLPEGKDQRGGRGGRSGGGRDRNDRGGRDGGRDGARGGARRNQGSQSGTPYVNRPPVPIPITPFLESDEHDDDLEKEFAREFEKFESAIDEYIPDSMVELDAGDVVDAIVVGVRDTDVLLDVGDKAECPVSIDEFKTPEGTIDVKPGDTVKVIITGRNSTGNVNVSHKKAMRQLGLVRIQEAYRNHSVLTGVIDKEVKGGLIVEVEGVQAFMPASQVDLQRVDELASWAGKTVNVYVIDYVRDRRRVIVSHREVLEEEQRVIRDEVIGQLNVGETVGATVKSITDFGVFVDLGGGVDGLIPREEVSWERGGHPSSYVNLGDNVRVKVLSITRGDKKTKISLSRKQAKADPYEILPVKYPIGSEVDGEIVGTTHFGAFVRIEEGIQGMIHVSDLSWSGGNKRVKDFVKVGDKVHCQVLEIDPERRRLSLGMKQLADDPWELIEVRFPPGSRLKGSVTSVVQYGAFIKISDDLEGLVHITDFSWDKKITKPAQMLKKGDEVECVVLQIDKDNRRLSLGMKQLEASPFDDFLAAKRVGDTVEGKITKIESFGAFVELVPMVEGLLHVSQISEQRIDDPKSVLNVGDAVQVKITKVDRKNQKISLSRREVLRDLEKAEIEGYSTSASEDVAIETESQRTTIKGSGGVMAESLRAALAAAGMKMPETAAAEVVAEEQAEKAAEKAAAEEAPAAEEPKAEEAPAAEEPKAEVAEDAPAAEGGEGEAPAEDSSDEEKKEGDA